jgi:hypothetical protein
MHKHRSAWKHRSAVPENTKALHRETPKRCTNTEAPGNTEFAEPRPCTADAARFTPQQEANSSAGRSSIQIDPDTVSNVTVFRSGAHFGGLGFRRTPSSGLGLSL